MDNFEALVMKAEVVIKEESCDPDEWQDDDFPERESCEMVSPVTVKEEDVAEEEEEEEDDSLLRPEVHLCLDDRAAEKDTLEERDPLALDGMDPKREIKAERTRTEQAVSTLESSSMEEESGGSWNESAGPSRVHDGSQGTEWSKAAIQMLISAVKQNECLYNVKHRLYHNKRARRDALHAVANKVRLHKKGATAEECKVKFQSLRSYYGVELNKIKASRKSGCAAGDAYQSGVWWFPAIDFLRGHVLPRKGTPNIPKACIPGTTTGVRKERSVIEKSTFREKTEGKNLNAVAIGLGKSMAPTRPENSRKMLSLPKENKGKKRKNNEDPFRLRLLSSVQKIASYLEWATKKKETSENAAFAAFVEKEVDRITDKKLQMIARHKIINTIMEIQKMDK